MKFREVVDSPCGLRYMFEALELSSGAARRAVLDSEMMTSAEEIRASQAKLAEFYTLFSDADTVSDPACASGDTYDSARGSGAHCGGVYFSAAGPVSAGRMWAKLAGLKDIAGTIARLASGATLDDVALFEVKELCLLSCDVAAVLSQAGVSSVSVPDLSAPLDILDPEGQRVPSFHVYDSYSPKIKELRDRLKKNPTESEILILESLKLEDEVRRELSDKLKKYAERLAEVLKVLIETDILLAKAMQMRTQGLIIPSISLDGQTKYTGLFHPQVREALAACGKEFQPVDIYFGGRPVTIIGANMGGKTVVLKMVALAQYLFQFGFGVPAAAAEIDIKESVRLYIGEEQSPAGGLSSFGAEVVRIDEAIVAARAGIRGLWLFDEPARTTNPVEGAALVSALVEVMSGRNTDLLLTTHYNLTAPDARRLRVKGFRDGKMDYELVEASSSEVPHEAIAIARSLDADAEWLERAQKLIMDRR